MRKLLLGLLCLTSNCTTDYTAQTYNNFVIIVASYNNEKYYKRNLDSILFQNYPTSHYRIIYTNDLSKDQTSQLVQKYVSAKNKWSIFTFIDNTKRLWAMENLYNMFKMCKPNEIAVIVDGDDWLIDSEVLNYLNSVYQDPNVWLTYGQYQLHQRYHRVKGICRPIPEEIIQNNAYRKYFKEHGFCASHLRTFRISLFDQCDHELLKKDGKFYQTTYDVALMSMLLEQCDGKFKLIDKILYGYNTDNPINDYKVYDRSSDLNHILNIRPK